MTLDKEEFIDLMSGAVCRFAHGKKCAMCKKLDATDIRIEYIAKPNATYQERENVIGKYLLNLVDLKKRIIKNSNKITPCCQPCHFKHSEGEEVDEGKGIYVSYFGLPVPKLKRRKK